MKTLLVLTSLVLVSGGLLATSASAGISPYARLAYGGNQLKMSDVNGSIASDETAFRSVGVQADLDRVGLASGLEASAGLWLFPAFRVGASWATQKSVTRNRVHAPGLFYGDDLEFRMKEIGAEAMIRVARLGGLSLGGQVAQGRAEFIEGFTVEDYSQQFYLDATGDYTKTTYAAFIGFEQTNTAGVAGSVRAGYHFRNMGRMPSQGTISDGVTSTPATGSTIPMDYSGFFLTVGIGFDLVR